GYVGNPERYSLLQSAHDEVEKGAEHHQKYKADIHARHVERRLGLQHRVANAGPCAHEFGDHGADQREDGADVQSGKDVGHCAWQTQMHEHLPASSAEGLNQLELGPVSDLETLQ